MTNSIAKLRRNHRLARTLCAVWLLAWLQTALVPCTMAANMVRQAGDAAQAMAHHMDIPAPATEQGVVDAAMEDCVYCPPGIEIDNQDLRCAYPRAPQVDARGLSQLQLDNLTHAVWVDAAWQVTSPLFDDGPPPRYVTPTPKTRPIALTYCVQLK